MSSLPKTLQDLIDDLSRLPGLGSRSASRIAFHLLRAPLDYSSRLGDNIREVKFKVKECIICGNYTEQQRCAICLDDKRDNTKILVVETPMDIIAFEATEYKGKYHALGGLISPLQGIGPEALHIQELLTRLSAEDSSVDELIFALPTSMEGESTVNYLASVLEEQLLSSKVRVSTLGRGLPTNSNIDHQDPSTLANSLKNRFGL